jgi:ribosome maturation factor RimP
MSSSSRHGSVRPPGTAASKPGTVPAAQGQPGSSRTGPGRPGSGRPGFGKPGPDARPPARPLPPIDADRVGRVVEPVIHALDLDLEAIRITAAGRRRVLRLVVDGDGGVSLDAIAVASRELSAVLDDSEVMGDHPYVLEVSSPGVDRPLTERRHWRRAIGRLVVAPLAAGLAEAGPGTAGAAQAGSAKAGSSKAGAAEAGPGQAGSAKAGSGKAGPGKAGSAKAGPGKAGSAKARSAKAGSAEAESAEDGAVDVVEGRVIGASADGITLDVNGESRQFGYGDLGPGRIKIEFAHLTDAAEDDLDDDEADADVLSAEEEGLNGY